MGEVQEGNNNSEENKLEFLKFFHLSVTGITDKTFSVTFLGLEFALIYTVISVLMMSL